MELPDGYGSPEWNRYIVANVIYKSTKSGHYSNGRAVISTAENVHQCMIDECLSMPAHEIEIILHDFEKNKLVEVKGIQRYSGHFTAIVDIISLDLFIKFLSHLRVAAKSGKGTSVTEFAGDELGACDKQTNADSSVPMMLKLYAKEINDLQDVCLFFSCNGKEMLVKKFKTSAASQTTQYVLKKPGRDIYRDELKTKIRSENPVETQKASDLIQVFPANNPALGEFIKRIFFKRLDSKCVHFRGDVNLKLP